MFNAAPAVYLAIAIFLLILLVLWCVLPFAIFGTKPKIDALIAEQQRTNVLLAQIADRKGLP